MTDQTSTLEQPATSYLPDTTSRQPRLAVFGGSFDPLHNAHLFIAGEIIRRELADEVLFVPAKQPPHKESVKLTDAETRLKMLYNTLSFYPDFAVSDIEVIREETSYTYDTLHLIAAAYTESDISFVMGGDSLAELHQWYRATELVQTFPLIIYPRPGFSMPSYAELAHRFGYKNARKLLDSVLDIHGFPVTATGVRELATRKMSLAGLVPESVQNFIVEYELYNQPQEGEEKDE
ncbi:MAG: nicotinate-nucleotide adenylyltransferase [Verrucomicrobiota bacterium]